MAKDTEKETLLDLFSTRSRGTASGAGLIEGPSGGSNAPAVRTNSSREVAEANKAARANAGPQAGRAAPLSAIGNAILREARKELGSQ